MIQINPLFARAPATGFHLLCLVILSCTLIILDRQDNHFSKVRTALSLFTVPIEYAVDWPIKMTGRIVSSISSHEALRKENAALRAEHILLQAQLQKYAVLEKENQQLHALLQSTPRVGGEVVVAHTLAIELAPFMQQIVLDSGSRQGVYPGQAVLDAQGVMGQIIQTGPLTSRVLLITDSRSAVPVTVERTGIRAIVEGKGSYNDLILVNMPRTADIKAGDKLLTSGLDQRFPEGYPVGVVSSIVDKPDQDFIDITVTPSAELHRSRLVLLVWPSAREQVLNEHLASVHDNEELTIQLEHHDTP